MIEVRWHGRGGQGVVTGSNLLARAAILEGKYAQHFPEFGPERSGAPVRSYTRISNQPIELHTGVYNPDIVVVIDPTMARNPEGFVQGLKRGGSLVLNYAGDVGRLSHIAGELDVKVHVVNAHRISLEEVGRKIYNVPMLAALARASGLVGLEAVKSALRSRFSGEALEINLRLLEKAYREVESLA